MDLDICYGSKNAFIQSENNHKKADKNAFKYDQKQHVY